MLLFDEMIIKQGVGFKKLVTVLFGLTDLGEVNNQLYLIIVTTNDSIHVNNLLLFSYRL